ncbi:protein-export chaperone SecB [Yersinia intermedia]|uniref:protein-export chaperone SecB n=1 Tax=Yersinia intermedia TaxID=631 RepID=UPI0011A3C6E7|nr:protein-export chaperone SecB [Yersinia intermedia]MCB5315623.1 protein-export chaperone SecB [Yersinia intermedia]MCB5329410.1 protein-export chaperone SecB [Yersinia intermedia]
MEYSIANIWVDKVNLERTEEKTNNKNQYELKIDCSLDYNSADKQSVRFVMDFSLHSNAKFKLSAIHYTIIKFSEQLTGDEAEAEMVRINAPSLLYPYIRAFCTNLLSSAGFSSEHLPLVFFDKK